MELKIMDCLAKVKVNFNQLKHIMKQTFNLDEAILGSITIVSNKSGESEDIIKRFVLLGINWQDILHFLPIYPKKSMNVNLHELHYKDFNVISPDVATLDSREFKFKITNKSDTGVILIQDYMAEPDQNLRQFIFKNIYVIGDKWVPQYVVGGKGGRSNTK